MISITKYIMEQEELEQKPNEKSWLRKKIIDPAKKAGDQALEIGSHLGTTMLIAGQGFRNPHLATAGALLPAVNNIKKALKAPV